VKDCEQQDLVGVPEFQLKEIEKSDESKTSVIGRRTWDVGRKINSRNVQIKCALRVIYAVNCGRLIAVFSGCKKNKENQFLNRIHVFINHTNISLKIYFHVYILLIIFIFRFTSFSANRTHSV
jgi:hypothetical protein